MGNAGNKAREVKGKPKTGKRVNEQKIQTASKTGILSLKESHLRTIPEDVFSLLLLKTLDLSFNKIECVPKYINALQNLKTLQLRENKLTTLVKLTALEKLTTLTLTNNALEDLNELPESLQVLNVAGNAFISIPTSVMACTGLKELDVSQNTILNIPRVIGQLTVLEKLVLDHNHLTHVPEELVSCKRLNILSLRNNQIRAKFDGDIQSIPEIVLRDANFQVLNLHANPMTKEDFGEMKGSGSFLERRKQLKDKEIHGGLDTDASVCGLN